MEIDIDFFIKNNKTDYIEQFMGALEILASINAETYKYIARVMFANNLYNVAKTYLDKSKEIFYNDAELHFIYAKYYTNKRNYIDANFHINECLRIIPNYFPALVIQKKLSEYLA